MSCYQSYKKKNILKTANYLLKQNCCDEDSCSQLVDDLQDTQFKCNDAFKNVGRNSLDIDEKGNIVGTVCALLRDKKNKILDKFTGVKTGGRKTRRRTRRRTRRQTRRKNKGQNKKQYKKTRGRSYNK
ncbi:MAG: hypothetical protein EBY20_00630 [Alphaproteobacteria bacterium]|uniref:Uncharacterized protein n=1 Tax=viral metagenome TaxID=1070528 RepID=A0A6C0HR41_9ZZZZ|nr:hypothetical protein [Alphaproteobacteria bacterium]